MKKLLIVFIGFIFVMTGCEKYNLKQPASLGLNWKFFTDSSSQGNLVINSGNFYCSSVTLNGDRVKGSDVSISQSLDNQLVTFEKSTSLYLSMDVPMGDYTSFDATFEIGESSGAVAGIQGELNYDGVVFPVLVQFTGLTELKFNNIDAFTLKKNESYHLNVGLDIENLFSGISSIQWGQALISNQNGIPTCVISKNINPHIYDELVEKLSGSLKLSIE